MAKITLILEDDGQDIKMKISSTDPDLPDRPDWHGIKSTDPDLTPAQAAIFEMLELYMKANNITDTTEAPTEGEPKKGCCGGKCKRHDN